MNWQTLSPSEKRLTAVFALLVAGLLNFLLLKFFLNHRARISEALSQKSAQLVAMQGLSEKSVFWKERSDWIRSTQPKLENEAAAGNLLLNFLKETAAKNGVTFSKQQLVSARQEAGGTAIPVKFELRGNWKGFCQFLIELQAPDRFLVVQEAVLRVDPADAKVMVGDLTIAKWFAAK